MSDLAIILRASWRDGLAVACALATLPIAALLLESLK